MASRPRGLRTALMAAAVLVATAALVWLYLYLNAGDTESAYPAQPGNVTHGKQAVLLR